MEQSETIGKLSEALSKVQGALEGAKLDSLNPFFKSAYSDLTSVWAACRKHLAENGLAVIQTCQSETPDIVIVETMLAHSSGEWVRGRVAMKPVKNDPQGIGSCITYARRYSLAAIVGVAPEDDDGNEASGKNKQETKKPEAKKEDKKEEKAKAPPTALSIGAGSALHKKLEETITLSKVNTEKFNQWLNEIGWLAPVDGKLEISSILETRAHTIIDKWDSCKTTYDTWLDAQRGTDE